jgi:hypothetical protein
LCRVRPKAALRAGPLFGAIHGVQDGYRHGRSALAKRLVAWNMTVRRVDDHRTAQCSADALDVALLGPFGGLGWRRSVFVAGDPSRVDRTRVREVAFILTQMPSKFGRPSSWRGG